MSAAFCSNEVDILKGTSFVAFLQKTIPKELEDKPQTGRKYLQKTHGVRDCYPKSTKSSAMRNKPPDVKMGQKPSRTLTSPKERRGRQISV